MSLVVAAVTPASGGGIGMGTLLAVASTMLIALAVGVLGWLAARRLNSGGVKTSTASDLWVESNAMRQELRDRLVAAEAVAAHAVQDVAAGRAELVLCQRKSFELETKTLLLERRVNELQDEVRELRGSHGH